jgi:hypothetical protein
MLESFVDPSPALPLIAARTTELSFNMASEPRTGALLQVLAASKPGGRLLELGTGTGLTTAWLLSAMDSASTLISVDTDPAVQAVAREALGNDPRLTLVLEDDLTFFQRQIPQLRHHLCRSHAGQIRMPRRSPGARRPWAASASSTTCSPSPTGPKATTRRPPRSSTCSLPGRIWTWPR